MKVIAFSSLKGGVGKTTAALFTAEALANGGRRVVAIDADANNNLTDALAREESPALWRSTRFIALSRDSAPWRMRHSRPPESRTDSRHARLRRAQRWNSRGTRRICIRFPGELRALDARGGNYRHPA